MFGPKLNITRQSSEQLQPVKKSQVIFRAKILKTGRHVWPEAKQSIATEQWSSGFRTKPSK